MQVSSPCSGGQRGQEFLWCSEDVCDVLPHSAFALALQQIKGGHSELRWHTGLGESINNKLMNSG